MPRTGLSPDVIFVGLGLPPENQIAIAGEVCRFSLFAKFCPPCFCGWLKIFMAWHFSTRNMRSTHIFLVSTDILLSYSTEIFTDAIEYVLDYISPTKRDNLEFFFEMCSPNSNKRWYFEKFSCLIRILGQGRRQSWKISWFSEPKSNNFLTMDPDFKNQFCKNNICSYCFFARIMQQQNFQANISSHIWFVLFWNCRKIPKKLCFSSKKNVCRQIQFHVPMCNATPRTLLIAAYAIDSRSLSKKNLKNTETTL